VKYADPSCADCPPTVRACIRDEAEVRGPGFCPAKVDPATQAQARELYADPGDRRLAQVAARVEAEGYCQWTRVQEIVEFARRMGWHKIGIATCVGLLDLAEVLAGILRSHGLEVISVCCKNGSIPKEEIGLADAEKIRPGGFEAACNPIPQAELLNAHGAEFNVVLGLCVGHDSLFFRHATAPTTVLATKDRVLGHNAIAALHMAGGYYSHLYGPGGPPAKRKKAAGG
jgi:uncharacterized metal-binding protein